MIHDSVVYVLPAQKWIPLESYHSYPVVLRFDDGNIEGTTTKVEDELEFWLFTSEIIQSKTESGSHWLTQSFFTIETSELGGFLRCQDLLVIEISRHSDDANLPSIPTEVTIYGSS